LLALVRLFAKRNLDEVWNFVLGAQREPRMDDVTPLFMSQQMKRKFLTVMFHTKTLEDLHSFLFNEVAKCSEISDTQTIPLIKPVFLPIPRERPQDIQRYSMTVKAHPRNYAHIYNFVVEKRHGVNLFVWYAAYALGEYDVFCSVFANRKKDIDAFSKSIRRLRGVMNVTPLPLRRTKVITSEDEWARLRVRLLHRPTWLTEELEKGMLLDYDLSVAHYSSIG